jgi:hypothetical protein
VAHLPKTEEERELNKRLKAVVAAKRKKRAKERAEERRAAKPITITAKPLSVPKYASIRITKARAARRFLVANGRNIQGRFAEFIMPRVEVSMPSEEEMARMAGELARDHIRAMLISGRDIEGKHYETKSSTRACRAYNMSPPKKSRSARYLKRYPQSGSLGGDVFFIDSGYLANNIQLIVEAGAAYLTAPPWREVAVNNFEKKGIPILSIGARCVENALKYSMEVTDWSDVTYRSTNLLMGALSRFASAFIEAAI